jgi:acetyltransferase-like isoleucine patch superfamily enzyme
MPKSMEQPNEYIREEEELLSRLLTTLNTWWIKGTYPFSTIGQSVRFHYACEISRRIATRISLGNKIEIGRHSWITCGAEGPHEQKIVIGDNCRIGPCCTISSKNSIQLERGVVLASDVLIQDHAHAYEDVSRPVRVQGPTSGGKIRIGEGCLIGRGAAIVCGRGELVIGKNSVVAPDAVVMSSFPPSSVLSGNPARATPQSSNGTNLIAKEATGRT